MDENEPLPEDLPDDILGVKWLKLSKEEIDYLSHRFEIRDQADIIQWAIKMLYDIAILDEDGWRLSFQKCDVNVDERTVDYKDYYPVHFSNLAVLGPNEKGFARLPLPKVLNKLQKIKKDSNNEE